MAATAKPEPGSRVSSLAWCQPLRSVDRKVAGRNASERIDSPDPQGSAAKSNVIEAADPIPLRGRQHPDTAAWRVGRDASGVRTAGMQPKDLTGTREIRPVQAQACRQAAKARTDRAEVRPADSTRRTGEPSTRGSGWRQVTRSWATWAPFNGSDNPLCKERIRLTMETDLERIAAKVL